jgi:hypothetical protein
MNVKQVVESSELINTIQSIQGILYDFRRVFYLFDSEDDPNAGRFIRLNHPNLYFILANKITDELIVGGSTSFYLRAKVTGKVLRTSEGVMTLVEIRELTTIGKWGTTEFFLSYAE